MPFEDLFYSYKTSMHIVIVGFPSELTFRVSKGKVDSAARPGQGAKPRGLLSGCLTSAWARERSFDLGEVQIETTLLNYSVKNP
jgi:hypothetical protein